jgi:hypothetical protein
VLSVREALLACICPWPEASKGADTQQKLIHPVLFSHDSGKYASAWHAAPLGWLSSIQEMAKAQPLLTFVVGYADTGGDPHIFHTKLTGS